MSDTQKSKGPSVEFLVKRTDGEWFSLHQDRFSEVLRPSSVASTTTGGWGDYRIAIPNGEIAFSFEEPGLHIVLENYSGTRDQALCIAKEILSNIESATGEHGSVVEL